MTDPAINKTILKGKRKEDNYEKEAYTRNGTVHCALRTCRLLRQQQCLKHYHHRRGNNHHDHDGARNRSRNYNYHHG